jgi:hypothetical protein
VCVRACVYYCLLVSGVNNCTSGYKKYKSFVCEDDAELASTVSPSHLQIIKKTAQNIFAHVVSLESRKETNCA